MGKSRAQGLRGRSTATRVIASVASAALLITATGQASHADSGANAVHSLMADSGAWAATGWSSTTGNQVSDVAKIIGSEGTGLDGTGVGIALIDTGVIPVPGLPASRLVNGPDLSFDAQAPHLRYLDEYGHGTHLAGIMVGDDPTVGLKGIAPKAKLTSIKVAAAGGVVDVTQVIAALNWVVQHKNDDPAYPIRVVELAYGTNSKANASTDPLYFAAENAFRNNIMVVVAAGNGTTALRNPATDIFMFSVGSANTKGTLSQSDDAVSTFTSISSSVDVDVVAPGEGIVSLRNPGSGIDVAYPGARVGESLFRGSGTSQSSAVVAGAAALLFQKYPNATPIQMMHWIRGTVKPLTGTNSSYIYGELNVANALRAGMPNYNGTGSFSSGLGSFEAARGSLHVVHNAATLSGSSDIFGSFNNSSWVSAVNNKRSWIGGVWMGHRLAGDGWTGTSWASKTWAGGTWSGNDWAGQTWQDASWYGRYWSGRYWSSGDWSGRYWSSTTWQADNFSANGWSSDSWR
jgi:serine protease AprX